MSSEDGSSAIKILLNPDLLRRYDPWKLSVNDLLQLFYDYLLELPLIDFRVTGLALNTSSLIYKFKAQRLFYEPSTYRKPTFELDYPLKELMAPYATEFPITDMNELLEAFRDLLKELEREGPISHPQAIEPASIPLLDEKSELEIIKPLEEMILNKLATVGHISFYDLIKGMDALNVIRHFFALLYLITAGQIEIAEGLEIILPR